MTKSPKSNSLTQSTEAIPVAIVGANGYTGVELTRLLLNHPGAEILSLTSRQYTGEKLATVFPSFAGRSNLKYEDLNVAQIARHIKAVFLCLPHHESMETARKFREFGVKVIDLSADFRFTNVKTYEKTYGEHTQKHLIKKACYGLCEIYKEDIKESTLVGVPGCYVTSILLALAPLLQNQLILPNPIICDSKSGTSGAGRNAKLDLIHAEVHNNFKAYGIVGHRHRPEIEEKLSQLAGQPIKITFTPHLLPISRGILSTVYVQPLRKWKDPAITRVFQRFYQSSPFVHILEGGESPQIKSVAGTNHCQISAHYDSHSEKLVVVSALDNLLKGASGQAVQCFNLMFGLSETAGLTDLAVYP